MKTIPLSKRWSPYKQTVIDFVAKNPGCCKMDVAKVVTYSKRRHPSHQYYIINTAIRNGWISAKFSGGRYYLTTS